MESNYIHQPVREGMTQREREERRGEEEESVERKREGGRMKGKEGEGGKINKCTGWKFRYSLPCK